ncbi:MAG: DUF3592 domain-containing protein [Terriglobales bacterium]
MNNPVYVILVSGLALVFGALCFFSLGKSLTFVNGAVKVPAEITRIEYRKSADRYFAVAKFKTEGGSIIECAGHLGFNPAPYHVGDKVSIFYDRTKPGLWYVDNFTELYLMPAVCGGFCILAGAVAVRMSLDTHYLTPLRPVDDKVKQS